MDTSIAQRGFGIAFNHSVQAETIPVKLKLHDQWVAWRFEQRNDKQTKVPYRVDTMISASTSDSTTWGAHESALDVLEMKNVGGIGFVFTTDDPFVGVDLDDCLDASGDSENHQPRTLAGPLHLIELQRVTGRAFRHTQRDTITHSDGITGTALGIQGQGGPASTSAPG